MRILVASVVVLVLAAGCGTEEQEPRTEPMPNDLVLEVERPGSLPVALYADGRLFTPAPQIAIFPPPALPAFSVARIPRERVQEIAESVRTENDPAKVDALLGDLPVSSGDRLHEPQALAVFVGPVQEPTEGIEPEIRDWPLAGALPAEGCVVVTGAELEPVLATAQRANQLTRWRSAGALVGLTFRPLLPHETSCDDVATASA
jgi:hypothetical protein